MDCEVQLKHFQAAVLKSPDGDFVVYSPRFKMQAKGPTAEQASAKLIGAVQQHLFRVFEQSEIKRYLQGLGFVPSASLPDDAAEAVHVTYSDLTYYFTVASS